MEDTQLHPKPLNKKRKIILLILLLLIIVGGIIIAFVLKNRRGSMDDYTKYWFDKMAQDGTLEGKSAQEIQSYLDQIVKEGEFNVTMNAEAVFDEKYEGSIGFENIEQNKYYARVVIVSDEDQSVLFESDGIKPGQYIDKIKLDTKLPSGDYPCTATVTATDPKSLMDISQVEVKMNITIVGQ